MAKVQYPLQQVLEVKQKRVEDAEAVVREKNEAFEREKKTLLQREEERDRVKKHQQDKLQQLRDELDHGTTSPKVQQMKAYLKVVDEKLKVEEKKVKEQQVKVEQAQKELEAARQQLELRRREVDKIQAHRESWEKEQRKEQELIQEKEQDELGNIIYGMRRKPGEEQIFPS